MNCAFTSHIISSEASSEFAYTIVWWQEMGCGSESGAKCGSLDTLKTRFLKTGLDWIEMKRGLKRGCGLCDDDGAQCIISWDGNWSSERTSSMAPAQLFRPRLLSEGLVKAAAKPEKVFFLPVRVSVIHIFLINHWLSNKFPTLTFGRLYVEGKSGKACGHSAISKRWWWSHGSGSMLIEKVLMLMIMMQYMLY